MTRAKQKEGKGYYLHVGTKITYSDRDKLDVIAKGMGMTLYQLLQALMLAMVRYFDAGSLITYEHNAMMNAFANTLFSLKDSYSPLSLNGHGKRIVNHAILLVEQPPMKQPQLMAVSKDQYGNLIESYNFDTMLSDFMGALDPEALQAITREQKKQGYFSIAHTLHELILQRAEKPADIMSQEIADMFTDARTTTGEQVNEDVHYNRKYNKGDDYTAPTPHKRRARADL
ncbi:MAG: hypothetical protein J5965_10890 [Aeriscardovia sp.]|nr:hypothetical protein [Aeriscardovia sp.]